MSNCKNEVLPYRNKNGFPPTICIQLLNWCNLNCTNCRSDSSPHKKGELEFELLKSILSKLGEKGTWRISLTGGEPFFYKDLNRLIEHINSLNFPFSITTNGYSSKATFDRINSKCWNNGTLYVSIDGNEAFHNSIRGNNSYERAVDFIKYARPAVEKLFVNTVLYSDPSVWAVDLYEELENIGVNNWTIISPVNRGRFLMEDDVNRNFADAYDFIKKIAKGKTSTSFLDFAKTDDSLTDIVFVNPDNSVRLPGYFNQDLNGTKQISKTIGINNQDVVEQIVNSVNNFLSTEKYML
jgi:MoaA/NifB/PqqE/SkfB family radical SAM enzyme